MTIASEISRLQWAKACIKASIENKWVTVWANVKLDSYSDCIDAIPSWSSDCFIDVLAVGWGGWGWGSGGNYWSWWWGWAWWVVNSHVKVICNSIPITIWAGGSWWCSWYGWWQWKDTCVSNINYLCEWNICNSIIAYWWWGWWLWYWWYWYNWWSWWGWWGIKGNGMASFWWQWCPWQWNSWWAMWRAGTNSIDYTGAGGWWYKSAWLGAFCGRKNGCTSSTLTTPDWWEWWYWDKWYTFCYAWWWGWWWYSSCRGYWKCWGGNWWNDSYDWCNATQYWWWGWWSGYSWYSWWKWSSWVVVIRYPADWSYWFSTATWWNCCNCVDGWCTHLFTSSGTFTIAW